MGWGPGGAGQSLAGADDRNLDALGSLESLRFPDQPWSFGVVGRSCCCCCCFTGAELDGGGGSGGTGEQPTPVRRRAIPTVAT